MPLANIAFLTPLAALAVLLALIPLAAFVGWSRRDTRARALLRIPAPLRRSRLAPPVAITAAAALIGIAAAQPVIQHSATRHQRTDAEVWVVFDISRSMAASPGARAPDRVVRARRFARALRPRLPGVPVGIASLTDRVLPHLFPTSEVSAFDTVTRGAINVEQPPPSRYYAGRATQLNALQEFVSAAYFRPDSRYRLLIVLTDGESGPFGSALAATLRKPPGVRVVFVHVWREDDRIYPTSTPDPNYRPDPSSRAALERAAEALHGTVVSESDVGGAAAAARQALGNGPVKSVRETARIALMPYVTLAAFIPLGFVLWRRNL